MSTINTPNTFTAAAFGAAALFSMLSFGGSAEAAQNLSQCYGKSTGSVVSCCEKLTEAQRPLWMIQTRTSCKQVVVCGGKLSSGRRCYVRIVRLDPNGGENPSTPDRGDPGRGDSGRGAQAAK
jgi:hypothetical protein